MQRKGFCISDMKRVLNDPQELAKFRSMDPFLSSMKDEEFQRIVRGVDRRLDVFTAKFGDMTDAELYARGQKK